MTTSNSGAIFGLTVLFTMLSVTRVCAQQCPPAGTFDTDEGTQGFLFRFSTIVIDDHTARFGSAINGAQSDYHSTDLTVVDGPTNDHFGDYVNLDNYEVNLGGHGFLAIARAWDVTVQAGLA